MRHLFALAAAAALAALALSACGAKKDSLSANAADDQSVSMELDWLPNADHVGIYEAQANGDFARAGLKVSLHVPSDPASPLSLVESGKVDVAVSYESELMLARNQGATLVSIGALVQRPLTSIISIGDHRITSPSQLRGKTIGTSGIPYERAYLRTILARAHVPQRTVKIVNTGTDLVPAMISGKVDATIGGFSNVEAVQLRRQHRKPAVIPVDRAGVPTYDELVLVTTEKYLSTHYNELRRFVQAIGRGYQAVRADPAKGVDALVSADPSLDRGLQTASVAASLPAFFPAGNRPFGWQDKVQWNAYGHWMLAHHLIASPQAYFAASTNQLLAGQGP